MHGIGVALTTRGFFKESPYKVIKHITEMKTENWNLRDVAAVLPASPRAEVALFHNPNSNPNLVLTPDH